MGIGVIAIQKGNFTLGRRQLDKDGNVVKKLRHAGNMIRRVPVWPLCR